MSLLVPSYNLGIPPHPEDILLDIFVPDHEEYDNKTVNYNFAAIVEACDMIKSGLSVQSIANYIGVPPKCFLDFLATHPQIFSRIKQASFDFQRGIISDLVEQSANGNFNASKFLLINRGDDWTDRPAPLIEEENTPLIEINHSYPE